jgi:hypothetical protein
MASKARKFVRSTSIVEFEFEPNAPANRTRTSNVQNVPLTERRTSNVLFTVLSEFLHP